MNKHLSFFAVLLSTVVFTGCEYIFGEKEPELPEFTRVTEQAGLAHSAGAGRCTSWADFNSDGFQDLTITNTSGRRGSKKFYFFVNNTDGTFTELEMDDEIEQLQVATTSWADFNNDALPDLVAGTTMSGAPPLLFRNKGEGKFEEVASRSGINVKGGSLQHTLWIDYNNDGYVDIFQANNGKSMLYRNNGDGTFSEVSEKAGVGKLLITNSAVWFDYNNDGHMDVFMANEEVKSMSAAGTNTLYRNNGDGTFTDVSEQAGVSGENSWDSVSACTGDYNNDGNIDLYVGNISSSRKALYKNNGDGTFSDVTEKTGTGDIGDARTCAWVDINSDGFPDLFTTNHLNPTKVYLNEDGKKFRDVAGEVGIDRPVDVFSATWGDYDNNGTMDVFLNGHMGTALMKNSGTSNKDLIVRLKGNGKKTNSAAIGSRITVKDSSQSQLKEVSGGRGYCEQDMLPVHFGIGKSESVDVRITWTDGSTCEFGDIKTETGAYLEIEQKDCSISTSSLLP